MNSLEFMEELFDTKPNDNFVLVWELKNKRSTWFKDLMHAATHIDNHPHDIYYGVGTSPANLGGKNRCTANKIAGIPGFYADIDIGEKDTGKKYPPSLDAALKLLHDDGADPSMIVHTGGGIHAYWLFKEFWEFEDRAEREQAAELSKRMCMWLKGKAKKNGWTIDSVYDLARILRPPGTFNAKHDPPLPVTVLEKNGPRYQAASDFDLIIPMSTKYDLDPDSIKLSSEEQKKMSRVLNLQATADPPADAMDLLLENDLDFKAAWRKKKNLKGDTSVSGFHWSLALIAIKNKWSNQEIGNLMVAWNRRHGEPMDKVLNPLYISRTIGNARLRVSGDTADSYVEELRGVTEAGHADKVSDNLKKKGLEILSHHCGFKVLRVIKYIHERIMKYRMEIELPVIGPTVIYFFSQADIVTRSKFLLQVFATTNIALTISNKNWEAIKEAFRHVIEDVIVSSENTLETRIRQWVQEYLDGQTPRDMDDAAKDNKPFIFDGFWYIFPTKFKEWCYRTKHDKEDVDKTRWDMKVVGAVEKRFNPTHPDDPNKRIPKRPWKIPHDVKSPTPDEITAAVRVTI